MIINKRHLDNYIKCNYLFALEVISGKKKITKEDINITVNKFIKYRTSILNSDGKDLSKNTIWFKDHVLKIISNEMKNGTKATIGMYRVKFTEKFQNSLLKIEPDGKLLVNKINTMLSPIVKNVCLGYNVPVEIPITGTNIIYKDIIDMIFLDKITGDVIAVEIDDIKSNLIDHKIRSWYHYKVPYTFISSTMDKNIRVFIIDPNTLETLEYYYHKSSFSSQYKHLVDMIIPIRDSSLTKNLFACCDCKYKEVCSDELAMKEIIYNGEDDE